MTFAQTIAAVAIVVVPLIGLQTFWVARSLDRLTDTINRMDDRLGGRLDHLSNDVVRDHGDRITRLEAAKP